MRSPATEPVRRLGSDAGKATRSGRWQAASALFALVALGAFLVARHGTAGARGGAAAAMAVAIAAFVAVELRHRRRFGDAVRLLGGPLARIDAARASKALRALSLLAEGDGPAPYRTSAELARLHVERAIAALPARELVEAEARRGRRLASASLLGAAVAVAVAIAYAPSVLEGADVLVARRGVAPVPMTWLGELDVSARPPDYLHQGELHELALQSVVLPYGTTLTMRGVPVRPGRRLLLGDGDVEVPFVDDGSGAVVARWTVTESRALRVVARFGEVVVPAPDSLEIQSIADAAPVVDLEDAPRRVRLIDAPGDVPLRFEATDDHGLREVQLVLRSGVREEHRVLARLDGETRAFRGGNVLPLRDAFLAKSHVPVQVTIEAKDNDPLTGPKWGASAAVTIVPPDVGERESRRLVALRAARDALVDSLDWRLQSAKDASGAKAFAAEDAKRADSDDAAVDRALAESYGGLRVPSRVRAVVVARQQATRKAIDAEVRAPSAATRAGVVKANERFVLVLDGAVRGLALRDARGSAKELADVADDLAGGTAQMRDGAPDARAKGVARADAATQVLAASGKTMRLLGSLGRDLGEIVEADLLRVARARSDRDLVHSELAARDLAARLREPDPSFGSRGGRGGRGGDEAGEASGEPGDGSGDDDAEGGDDAEQAFNEAAQDLERLAGEHASEIAKMEEALAGAVSDAELKRLREEAKRHAQSIRDAARGLPAVGMGSDSWTSKGSAARELAEQMARSLEDARPDEAAQTGRSAIGALDEAKRMLQRGGWFEDMQGDGQRRVDDARRTLDAEARWAEEQVAELRSRASARAREQLEQGGREEGRLAERAGDLADRGRHAASLPQQALEAIEEGERAASQAAQALQAGSGDKGLEHQREAQRHLEAAREQLRSDDEEASASRGADGDARQPSGDAPVWIPGANDHKGPEEFRRRVMRGLGERSSASLRDAVQRYAEGLLR